MAEPLKSWHAPDPQQAARLVRNVLGVTPEIARALVAQVERDGLTEFVAELRIQVARTAAVPAGASRWQLWIDDGQLGKFWRLDKMARDVVPHAATREGRRL